MTPIEYELKKRNLETVIGCLEFVIQQDTEKLSKAKTLLQKLEEKWHGAENNPSKPMETK